MNTPKIDVVNKILKRLKNYHHTYGDLFPAYGEGKRYKLTENQNWLASFWSGILWLSYYASQDEELRNHAARLLPTFKKRLDQQIHLNHDLGFIFTLSARAQFQLTQDTVARDLALRGADELLRRYNSNGQYIQAWREIGHKDEAGRFIIDAMLNIPLLFWATEITGDAMYRAAGEAHAETSQRYLVREDGSTYHTYHLHPQTGHPVKPETHQGYNNESMWARGQAWSIAGFAIAADWTGRADFLDTAQKSAERFMAELPANGVPTWDLRLPLDTPQYLDSSASAIAASGLQRLAHLTNNQHYADWADYLLTKLIEHCLETDSSAEGFLKHGTLHAIKGWAIDEYQIFGDYFFLEALLMFNKTVPDFWGPQGESL